MSTIATSLSSTLYSTSHRQINTQRQTSDNPPKTPSSIGSLSGSMSYSERGFKAEFFASNFKDSTSALSLRDSASSFKRVEVFAGAVFASSYRATPTEKTPSISGCKRSRKEVESKATKLFLSTASSTEGAVLPRSRTHLQRESNGRFKKSEKETFPNKFTSQLDPDETAVKSEFLVFSADSSLDVDVASDLATTAEDFSAESLNDPFTFDEDVRDDEERKIYRESTKTYASTHSCEAPSYLGIDLTTPAIRKINAHRFQSQGTLPPIPVISTQDFEAISSIGWMIPSALLLAKV